MLWGRSVKGTSTKTTSPGCRLLIEVGLIAKEVERRVADQKGDLGGLSLPDTDEANLNGILTRRDGFGKLHMPGIYQSAVDRNHACILAHRRAGGKPQARRRAPSRKAFPMADYIPGGDAALNAWLDNFVTYATANLANLGLVAGDLTPVTEENVELRVEN